MKLRAKMSYNETYWSHSTSATENEPMEQAHDNHGYPWWLEEVVGCAGAAVLLIVCIIVGIKNPDLARRLLSHGQDFLSMMMERIRNRGRRAPPPLPPRNGIPRNFTDDEMIEMRECQNGGQYDALARSVWI